MSLLQDCKVNHQWNTRLGISNSQGSIWREMRLTFPALIPLTISVRDNKVPLSWLFASSNLLSSGIDLSRLSHRPDLDLSRRAATSCCCRSCCCSFLGLVESLLTPVPPRASSCLPSDRKASVLACRKESAPQTASMTPGHHLGDFKEAVLVSSKRWPSSTAASISSTRRIFLIEAPPLCTT